MKLLIELAFLIILLTGCQEKNKEKSDLSMNNDDKSKVSEYLNKLTEMDFSGSILIEHKGEIISEMGYGFSDRENNIKNTVETVFDIGSITKQFTAAAILKLEMTGKLSVNDKISKYFINVPDDKQQISLHHLLTHTSGLKPALGGDYEMISPDDFINKAFQQKLLFPIGDSYEYSNVGYSLLAMIIEKVSKTTYEDYLYQNLWKPAKMEQTGYLIPKFRNEMIAVGYRRSNTWGRPNEKWNRAVSWHLKGNGGVLSTVKDMYKWHQALLNEDILSKEAKDKYYKPYVREGEGAPSFYGYGWAIYPTPRDTYLIAHNGGNNIFFADFWRYLTEGVTVIMMTNSYIPKSEVINMNISGLLLNPDYEPVIGMEEDDDSNGDGGAIDKIVERFFDTLQSEDKSLWEKFLLGNAAPEFLEMAPMEMHLSMFEKFHKIAKSQQITDVSSDDGEVIVKLTGGKSLIITIDQYGKDKFGIAGIMVE